jgi:hypothetical protein
VHVLRSVLTASNGIEFCNIFASIQLRGTAPISFSTQVLSLTTEHYDRTNMVGANGSNGSNNSNTQNGDHAARVGTIRVKQGLAQMLKGGVIVCRFKRVVLRLFVRCCL